MEQLNNLDVFFLVIVAISALVGIARGFTKESLSLVGWAVAAAAVYFLTPAANAIMKNYIASEMLSKFVSGLLVLLTVCIFWVLAVDKITSTIRQSKLSPLDRIFGLGFGVLRGAIVVILLVMMISALIPEDSKKGVFAESKLFVASEGFIEPIKALIPEETMKDMQSQMEKLGFGAKNTEEKADDEQKGEEKSVAEDKKVEKDDKKSEDKAVKESDDKEKTEEEKPAEEKEKKVEKKDTKTISDNAKEAFMELAQPKIENAEDVKNATETFDEMSGELQKLMDALEDQTIEVDSEDYGL